jgi:hypothetical protein
MSSASSKSLGPWQELDCPRCRARFRIKSAYSHMGGRCPNCGTPIEAPRPVPPPAPVSFDSDEPLGLVPIEEEWPEPGQMDVDDRPLYDLGASPSQWAEPPSPKAPELEGYGLAKPSPTAPSLPSAPLISEAYQVRPFETSPGAAASGSAAPSVEEVLGLRTSPPADASSTTPSNEPEHIPAPPPLPPAHPLWSGVYDFPWRKENVGSWIYLSLALTLISLVGAGLLFLIAGGATAVFAPVVIPPLAIITFFTVNYAAAHFLTKLQDTAAGSDVCQKPELGAEWLGHSIFLIYIFVMSLAPCGLAAVVAYAFAPPDSYWWPLGLILSAILFPIMLLSSLVAESRWMVLHPAVIMGLLKKPLTFFVLSFVSVAMMALCTALGYGTMLGFLFLAPLFGIFAATCLLIYARLLGRVGWVLTQGAIKPRKRKRKRKKPESDAWGPGTEVPAGERDAG